MKSVFNKVATLVLLAVVCFSSAMVVPTQAHINISGSTSGGITISPGGGVDMTDVDGAFDAMTGTVVSKGQSVAKTITSVCCIICFVVFFISIVKLATSGSHPMQRRAAIIGILWSGAAIMLFGGAWVVVSFFWNFLSP